MARAREGTGAVIEVELLDDWAADDRERRGTSGRGLDTQKFKAWIQERFDRGHDDR